MLEQWLREARHVGRLAHPCIVPVFESDVQGSQPYIVFEYVPGHTLAEHLAQQGRCTTPWRLWWMCSMACTPPTWRASCTVTSR